MKRKPLELSIIPRRYLLSLLVLGILLYFWKLLFFGFSSDDYFHLWAAKYNNINEFINLFTFDYSLNKIDYIFYRPLTTHVYYGVISKYFHFNPLPFSAVSLIFHILNTLLVFKLYKLFIQDKRDKFAYIAAAIYGFNPSHSISVAWAGAFQEIGVTFFILLSIIFFYKNIISSKRAYLFASVIFFLLALLSKEGAILLPFFLIIIILISKSMKNLLKTIPFFIIVTLYSYMHFVVYNFEQTEGYTFIINSQFINTLRWHIWWALGFPEIFTNYIGSNLMIQPKLWTDFLKESMIAIPLFVLLISILVFLIFAIAKYKRRELYDNKLALFALMYLIFLLPVLFLPQNKHAYHQTTSLVGLSIVIALLMNKFEELKIKYNKVYINAAIVIFLIISYISIDLSSKHNFILLRSKISHHVLSTFVHKNPTLPKNTIIYIKNEKNTPTQLDEYSIAIQSYYALRGAYAFKLFYGNEISVYYEGVKEPPGNTDDSKVMEYIVTFD